MCVCLRLCVCVCVCMCVCACVCACVCWYRSDSLRKRFDHSVYSHGLRVAGKITISNTEYLFGAYYAINVSRHCAKHMGFSERIHVTLN